MIRATRSQPGPKSLANKKSYDGVRVKAQLLSDFASKCYLCENAITAGSMEVDHRKPKAAFPQHEFAWENLFPTCDDCNGRRPTNFSDGSKRQYPEAAELLDPTVHDVEALLVQRYERFGRSPAERFLFAALDSTMLSAVFTAEELRHLHTDASTKAEDLRDAIKDQILAFFLAYCELEEAEHDGQHSQEERALLRERVRVLVSRRAPFTMLVRSVVPARLHSLFDR